MPDCRQRRLALSEYKDMWLFAVFDLLVDTMEARRRATEDASKVHREGL